MRVPSALWLVVALWMAATFPYGVPIVPADVYRGAPSHSPRLAPFDTPQIIITGVGANPQTLTVAAGTPIHWLNEDGINHTITAQDDSFPAFTLPAGGGPMDLTISASGTYTYSIDHVINVTGVIIVQAADATETPSATPSPSLTPAPPTGTPSPTLSPTATATPSRTSTIPPVATATGTATRTSTPSPIATATPSRTATATLAPTATPRPSATAVDTATPAVTATGTPAGNAVPVTVTASGFAPQVVTIAPGLYVRWTNLASFAVGIQGAGPGGSFGSPVPIQPGASWSQLFAVAGSYPYALVVNGTIAAGITGTVKVETSAPTATPAPATATHTATAAATAVATATHTPSPSETATATYTPSGVPASPTPTAAPSTTGTARPAATATASASSTTTASGNVTATATATTAPTTTATPAVTATPTPTFTDTPQPNIAPVAIEESGFVPQTVTIPPGMYVQWTNHLASSVTITSADGLFGGVPIPPGGSWKQLFGQAGTYLYALAENPSITGAVNVLAPSPTPSPSAAPTNTATATPAATATTLAAPTPSPTTAPSLTPAPSPTMLPSPTPTRPATAPPSPTPPPPLPAAATATATGSVPAQPPVAPGGGLSMTPLPSPSAAQPSPTPTPTAVRHRRPPRHPAPPAGTSGVGLTLTGWVGRGSTRVTLSFVVSQRAGHLSGTLLLRDPGARLTLSLARFSRLRLTPHGVILEGLLRAGRRTMAFDLDVGLRPHATTLSLVVTPLRYRLSGAFHGRMALRVTPESGRGPARVLAAPRRRPPSRA